MTISSDSILVMLETIAILSLILRTSVRLGQRITRIECQLEEVLKDLHEMK
jgi:hypothetical protein